MQFRAGIISGLIFLLTIQQAVDVEANWFTELFKGWGGSRSGSNTESGTSQAEAAHDAVYGTGSGTQTQFHVPSGPNKGSRMRELIAAAAGFEAMRTYERHQAQRTGQPANHSIMKGVLAGLAAAAVDHLIETKGLDYIDRARAKTEAQRTAENIVNEKYGLQSPTDNTVDQSGDNEYNPNQGYQMTTQAGEYR